VGYLAAYALSDRQRDAFAGLSGWGVVIGFSAAMLTAAASAYLVGSLVYWRLTPPQPLLVQSIVTVVLYPLVAIILGVIHRNVVGASRGDD
jgi:rod shape-determining protein MreD